ncbi:hypothetical protein [Actinoplanes sp. DH11]|uniref:hypothetical protein n=1 Tax=Actinoplanes sp. DH11 TaxID=2857011 RepID=UPI001E4A2304|nr:hypothetical protein [Actinoplanes sp. DH11]
MDWLEFALLHADEPRTVQVDGTDVGPCLVHGEVIFCPPDTVAEPGTRVTLPGGRAVRVRNAIFMDALGTRLPEHLQLDVEAGGSDRYRSAKHSMSRHNGRGV